MNPITAVKPAEVELQERIRSLIASHRVVLFMKGSRAFPQCGFSAKAVDLLDECIPEYATVDVLEDPELREAVKAYSDWPTYPQLYVGGQLVGGSDIVAELAESGELPALVSAR